MIEEIIIIIAIFWVLSWDNFCTLCFTPITFAKHLWHVIFFNFADDISETQRGQVYCPMVARTGI